MRKQKQSSEKGITLIALVITIIVLLILAGVSILTLTGENGILTKAENSRNGSTKAGAKEQIQIEVMASLRGDGTLDNEKIKKNLNNIEGIGGIPEGDITYPFNVTVDGYTFSIDNDGSIVEKIISDRTGIEIGDYIDYQPDQTDDVVNKEDLKDTGTSIKPVIRQENTKWRVMRVHDDGSIDLISNLLTLTTIYLDREEGYTYGVDILNDVCAKLYSRRSSGIVARCVNMDDIDYHLTSEGMDIKNKYYGKILQKPFSVAKSYYPKIYQYEIGAGINTTKVNDTGLGRNDSIKELIKKGITDLSSRDQAQVGGLTMMKTCYGIEFNEENLGESYKIFYTPSYHWWIASRYANWFDSIDYGYFGLMDGSDYTRGESLCYSNKSNNASAPGLGLRPVVTLGSGVEIEISENASNVDKPHKIKKY